MKIDTDWKQYSVKHEIDISKISDPYEITDLFSQMKIDKYVYRIKYKGIVIKFGMSCPSSSSARYGDRVYRQIGHNKSWNTKRLTGSSGSDWRIIEEDFTNEYGFNIDHNHMTLTIWDLTNYPFRTCNPFLEVNAIENSLIEQYVDITGSKPIGNINDEANIKKKSAVPKELANFLFDWRIS
jgi:hypothetical protein